MVHKNATKLKLCTATIASHTTERMILLICSLGDISCSALLLIQATEVNSWVLELTAKEVDVYPEFSNLTYSIVIMFLLVQ